MKSNQRGSVLIITLVLLSIMTVAAVSLLESGQFQAFMVRNLQFTERIYEESLSENEAQIAKLHRDDRQIVVALNTVGPVLQPPFSPEDAAIDRAISLEYLGETRASIGSSIEGGSATGLSLALQSNVQLSSQHITSDQTQALTYVKPK